MDFRLTSEQEMIRDMVRDFTEKNIKPVAALYDEEKQFPYENLKKMANLGLMGMIFPPNSADLRSGWSLIAWPLQRLQRDALLMPSPPL